MSKDATAHASGHEDHEPKGAAPLDAEHHKAHVRKYLRVFGALILLTGLELGVVYAGLPKSTLILLLIGLALAKAGAVALWFMHLADERRVMRYMVGLPLLFPPFYACVLIAEAIARSRFFE
jgi:caa(3)-type oxidase subunit IV